MLLWVREIAEIGAGVVSVSCSTDGIHRHNYRLLQARALWQVLLARLESEALRLRASGLHSGGLHLAEASPRYCPCLALGIGAHFRKRLRGLVQD